MSAFTNHHPNQHFNKPILATIQAVFYFVHTTDPVLVYNTSEAIVYVTTTNHPRLVKDKLIKKQRVLLPLPALDNYLPHHLVSTSTSIGEKSLTFRFRDRTNSKYLFCQGDQTGILSLPRSSVKDLPQFIPRDKHLYRQGTQSCNCHDTSQN